MMCANSGEDWTIIEGGVAKKRVFLKFKMAEVGGQAVLGRQQWAPTPWLTERHGYDPTF